MMKIRIPACHIKFILASCLAFLSGQMLMGQAINPIIHADVPDMSMIRVGNEYYMSSTTMHMSPGLPIMKSKDLSNWELISYAYDTLVSNDAMNLENGKQTYGRGSWASCLNYQNGEFIVTTFSATSGQTHVYRTKDPAKGPWKTNSFSPSYHDHTIFFDDDGRVYMIYGAGKLLLKELKPDLTGLKEGGLDQVLIENASAPAGPNIMLGAEGSQLYKINGKYYLFNITWPRGGMRTVVIHRADKITGPWEGRVGLQDLGVAQGGLISTPDGKWFSYLFRDYGAVGRIPYIVPVKWEDGWPVLGEEGKVPMKLDLPKKKSLIPGLVQSDDFSRKDNGNFLPLAWQWNHNPDNKYWSLHENKGFLTLTTFRKDTSFVTCKNTLTQRTIGPKSSASVKINTSKMKDGDIGGFGLLQKNYGYVGVVKEGKKRYLVMSNNVGGAEHVVKKNALKKKDVYLKAECDFLERADTAQFYYSLDGKKWEAIGDPLKMSYTLPHFMGYRYALFNYATKNTGGKLLFDHYEINDLNENN